MRIIGVYFVFAVVCLNFVLVNLFIGVLCFHFGEAKNSALKSTVIFTREQQVWMDLQKMIVKAKIGKIKKKKKIVEGKFNMKKVLTSRAFDIFIMICIFLNIIIMCMNYEGSPSYYDYILDDFNYGFTGVFILECLLKIWEYGFFGYIKDDWCKMDLVIVLLSVVDILFTFSGDSANQFLRTGPQIIRLFRIVRVVRMLKLLKQLEGLKKIMQNLILSLPNVFSVFLLLLLFFFIFSVLGVFLFKDITSGNSITSDNNFRNFIPAFFILLEILSGSGWSEFMFDCFNLSPDCIPGQTCGTSKF